RRQSLAGTTTPSPTQTAGGKVMNAAAPAAGAMKSQQGQAADGVRAQEATDKKDNRDESQAAAPTPRTNFVDTPLWVPDLVTGDDGHASASVQLPDNLTTWRLNARAISKLTYVGDTTLDIISTKPLLVRPSTPRFFVVG